MVSKFKLEPLGNTDTNKSISRTLQIASTYTGELSIEVLPLDTIELDPENNRDMKLTLQDAINGIDPSDPEFEQKRKDWKSLESLANTINSNQLINPVFVYRYGNKCRLIAGERRTLASAIAGKKEIIARIANQRPLGTKLKILQWIENNERIDLSLSERVSSLEAIVKEYAVENKANTKITAQIISDLTGMSKTQAARYNLILRAESEIRSAIAEGKLENLKYVEFICSIEDKEHRKEILDAIVAGKSFDSVVKLKNEMNNRQNKTRSIVINQAKNMISLGKANTKVARTIVESLISAGFLEPKYVKKIQIILDETRWDNHSSAENGFKKIINILLNG